MLCFEIRPCSTRCKKNEIFVNSLVTFNCFLSFLLEWRTLFCEKQIELVFM